MRAFERQANESEKAYAAFCCYRDLGSARSLAKAAETYYGSRANLAQVGVWSSKFSWVERARSYDDWLEMVGRAAVENHLRRGAEDRARREAALVDCGLEARERAMEKVMTMLAWPLARQRRVQEGPDGEDAVYIFEPSRWTLGTAVQLHRMALGDAPPPEEEIPTSFDFSNFTEEELVQFLELSERLGIRPSEGRG